MINLNLRDLLKKKIYIVRYGGTQHFKTSNRNTLKRLQKALNVLGIKDYHVYTITIRKEEIRDV